jgi:formylglycine-generating enzyme required for sulfatase activity
MGKYEVTQAEWEVVMGKAPSSFKSCGDNCPVEQVSWNDIQTFLQKLSAKTGKVFRLPADDEWEYSCLGGRSDMWTNPMYCGSDESFDTVAWISLNSNDTTHPIGQKQANGYGLFDMSGNVWEWTSDCYSNGCVIRGGGFGENKQYVKFKSHIYQGDSKSFIGFRLARTLP